MGYTALPDQRMPYHRDGSRMLQATNTGGIFGSNQTWPSGGDTIALNGMAIGTTHAASSGLAEELCTWVFFPESREVTAIYYSLNFAPDFVTFQGSSDTTNGIDGTWETATFTPVPQPAASIDDWRSLIKSVSFTGPKRAVRLRARKDGIASTNLRVIHLYGEKAAGQTPNDLIFIDHDTTPGVEYTAPEDFGDRPLGTSVVRQFRVKNASATLTANTINLQCNDADFAISTDGTTWVVTIDIASLAAGAESATMYVRNTTPAPGATIGPRFAEIVALVGSWT